MISRWVRSGNLEISPIKKVSVFGFQEIVDVFTTFTAV